VSNILIETATGPSADPDAAIRKVTWRLIPLLFILYIVNYLDRINIGFAALPMNRDLHRRPPSVSPTRFSMPATSLARFQATC
jgi:hypothetical protein